MPRFTFAWGNLRKIAALPAYGLGALASLAVRRDESSWVFGSGAGVGEGALSLLHEVRATRPDVRCVWLARDEADARDARALGIPAVSRDGLAGLRATLRARVLVITHGFGDVSRYGTRGALVVQLWHGIPYKRLHRDSPVALRLPGLPALRVVSSLLRHAHGRVARGIGLFVVASPLAGERIRSAFGLRDDQIVVTGDPRDDVLLAPDASRPSARRRLAELLDAPELSSGDIVLYAPTWRDGAPDPGVPDAGEWARIADHLERTGSHLLIRPHPLGRGAYESGARGIARVHMLGSDLVRDVTPVLPAVDVLVTDYSSIAFDFALLARPIVFLAPDAERYAAVRGVYEPYAALTGGSHVERWDDVLTRLADVTGAGREPAREQARSLAARHHAFTDGRATQRVLEEIERRLAGTLSARTLDRTVAEVGGARGDGQRACSAHASAVGVTLARRGDVAVVEIDGPVDPEGVVIDAVQFVGDRQRLSATVARDGARWSARLELCARRWGVPLPVPPGAYQVQLVASDGTVVPVRPVPAPELDVPGVMRVSVTTDGVGVRPSWGPGEPLRRDPARRSRRIDRGSVFFESFAGRSASCNPRGIDRALAREHPAVTRFWSVADTSVEVPEGAVGVVIGSRAWWEARSRAQVLVVNDWLRQEVVRRPGQTVLQTWHGTPLKRIALLRPGVRPRAAVATWREARRWDVLLAQNPFSVDALRRSYAFRGPVWEEGYPRNDVLTDAGARARVRERLGVDDTTTVVLYAPTWRDDRLDVVDHLDVARFAAALGPGHLTLLRGHARTMQAARDVAAPGVLDVTTYPDTADLLAAADLLVTDYSSVMFDFTGTGKPLLFHVPDLEDYRDRLRGFMFDLETVAPGPVVAGSDELVDLVHDRSAALAPYAERYRTWQARFNPRDDGGAGARVVARLVAEGRLTP